MARQVGPFFIVGRLGNLDFYEMKGGYFVKLVKGSSEKRKQGERSQENFREFRHLLEVGMEMRTILGLHWKLIKDPQRSGNLTKYLNLVKKEDTVSARGKRSFFEGLRSHEGKKALEGADLNQFAELKSAISISNKLKVTLDSVQLKGIVPSRDIRFPKDSHAVRVSAVRLEVSLDEQRFLKVTSEVQVIRREDQSIDLLLHLPKLQSNASVHIILLSMNFVAEAESISGVKDARKENVLTVVKVF